MTFVVPFDASDLSGAALVRAVEFGATLDEPVVAVTVVPVENARYASERGWLDAGDAFEYDVVVERLRGLVAAVAPGVDHRFVRVDRYAPSGTIASAVRRLAVSLEASMVFVGSENAGRLVSTLTSVGSNVASDPAYDVVIVRHVETAEIAALDEQSPFSDPDSSYTRPD